MSSSVKISVFDLLSPILDGEGIKLVDVEYENQKKNRTLRLLIYKPDGITITDCQHVSEIVGPVLQMNGLKLDSHSLEVASLGLDRPLSTETDYRRNLSKNIQIEVLSPSGKFLQLSGILEDVNWRKIYLTQRSGETIQVGLSEITKAHVQLMW
jgi:ribosome maturation factor RimP